MRSAKTYGKVAVLMGGVSAEREISLKSGEAVLNALLRKGIDAHRVDPAENLLKQLQEGNYNRVFIMLHGSFGEDGVVQGFLETLNLPYTGSGVMASAVGMDKIRTKKLWLASGLPTPKFLEIKASEDLSHVEGQLGLPVIVKPVREGSSIGMSKVEEASALLPAWSQAMSFGGRVLVEQWVHGKEYTVAILDGVALPAIRLETPNKFYDFHAKYQADTTRYHCPCGLSETKEKEVKALALSAFDVLGARGWGRVDFMLDEQENSWLIELNSLPGMTDHSLFPMAAKQAGIDFDSLVVRILDTSF
ncbi:MAG: D-alanine--D-alanine ligase [Gammaproteobacteria bacterium]|nr:D-alanine--D-alanine ligase [Gammaproteobacteria bacterium]